MQNYACIRSEFKCFVFFFSVIFLAVDYFWITVIALF